MSRDLIRDRSWPSDHPLAWEPSLLPSENEYAGSISSYIDEIIEWLERNGVRVHRYALELPASGMYRSETREIFLNQYNPLAALLALAYEAGHWLSYPIEEKLHGYRRDRQAFVYGWHVLRWFDAPISRALWIEANHSRRGQRRMRGVPAAEHLFRE